MVFSSQIVLKKKLKIYLPRLRCIFPIRYEKKKRKKNSEVKKNFYKFFSLVEPKGIFRKNFHSFPILICRSIVTKKKKMVFYLRTIRN